MRTPSPLPYTPPRPRPRLRGRGAFRVVYVSCAFCALCVSCALFALCAFHTPAASAAPAPRGGFGFQWDDGARVAETKAAGLGLRPTGRQETSYGVEEQRYEGKLLGYPATLRLRFYKGRLYDAAALLGAGEDDFFMLRKALEDLYGGARKYYGIASDHGATEGQWRIDPTIISLSLRADGVSLRYSHYQNALRALDEMYKDRRQRLDDLRRALERGAN